MKNKEIKNLILTHLNQNETLSVAELVDLLHKIDVTLKPATLRWKIYALRKEGLITDVYRGVYTLKKNKKSEFLPTDFKSNNLKKIATKISSEMPYLKFCVWTTSWLNELMLHQLARGIRLLEVEAGTESAVFSLLENAQNDILVNPSKEEIDKYLIGSDKLVIKSLLHDSPINKSSIAPTPKLEKILVDLFLDKELFYSLQGSELVNIFVNAMQTYKVNLTTLLAYAERRNKKAELLDYIKLNIKEKLNDTHGLALDRVVTRS